ncbi:MAG TPA: hypothetical protein VF648_20315 [Pyrinomonadaceae bacterium]|jgi:hypothetical protein
MNRIIALVVFFLYAFVFSNPGQTRPKEQWQELNSKSKAIIVGVVEDYLQVIRPEKLKANADGTLPIPNPNEYVAGQVFRVKLTDRIKGKVKTQRIGNKEYIYVFIWGRGVPGIGDPILLENKEYVLFLEPNNEEKELAGTETADYKPNEIIKKPFDYKSSYLIIRFGGATEVKGDKNKLIKEIKRAL